MVVPVKFANACAASDDIFLIATIPDGLPDGGEFTRLYYLNPSTEDVWHYRDWPNHEVVSVCLRRAREGLSRAGCALTGNGDIELANSTDQHYEKITGAGLAGERAFGDLTRIREIGSSLFACGGSGQVYTRHDGDWTPIDDGLVARDGNLFELPQSDTPISNAALRRLTQSFRRVPNFNDIDGVDEEDLYVCGNGGNLFHYDGLSWTKIDLDTDATLTAMHCVSADEIWIVGQDGIILFGNARSGFRRLSGFVPAANIWSVRHFQGQVYLGTSRGLYRLDGPSPTLIRRGRLNEMTRIVSIDSIDSFSDTILWIATDRHAFRYDGDDFAFFEHQDNVSY